MAFDVEAISREAEFDFTTSAFGLVRVGVLTTYEIQSARVALEVDISPDKLVNFV